MGKKIVTAIGSDNIYESLKKSGYEVIPDVSYREGVIELIKKEFTDVLIVYSELSGDIDKYIFIDMLKQLDAKMKIIVITDNDDENYKRFLWSKGIFDIFINGVASLEELEKSINDDACYAQKVDLRNKNRLNILTIDKPEKNRLNGNLSLKFQKQQVITFTGVGSTGKTTIASRTAEILAEKTGAKVLLIDFDTVNAGVNLITKVKRGPENPGYILPPEKNSSLNYIIDAIDKRTFNANIFEKYVIKSKDFSNLHILTGNKSLYICKNILSSEYYSRILETAKSLYDYIIIDASGNIFLDSMQFSVLNANKIFVVTEGNYISIERNYRLVTELFPVWGVHEKKIRIIVNKYGIGSIDKNTVAELFKKYVIAGYISFSEKYEEMINGICKKLPKDIAEQYCSVLQKTEIISGKEYLKNFSRNREKLKLKINSFMLKNV